MLGLHYFFLHFTFITSNVASKKIIDFVLKHFKASCVVFLKNIPVSTTRFFLPLMGQTFLSLDFNLKAKIWDSQLFELADRVNDFKKIFGAGLTRGLSPLLVKV
jgi:hypothetical protein